MKKVLILFTIFMIIFMIGCVYAVRNSDELDFSVINNEQNEDVDLYVLLPKEYIQYAISYAGMYVNYDGPETLKQNEIPGIDIEKENVQDEIYEEDGIEYVQVLLEEEEEGNYKFNMLRNYSDISLKFRIKTGEKDYIAHIDNFKTEDGVCEIQYDYSNNIIKQPDKVIIKKNILVLMIILVIVIIVGIISYIKQGR